MIGLIELNEPLSFLCLMCMIFFHKMAHVIFGFFTLCEKNRASCKNNQWQNNTL